MLVASPEYKKDIKLVKAFLENQDVEEEFLLQIKMDELMINDEDEATGEDSEIIDEPVLVLPAIAAKKKEAKQSQITDFFKSTK